MLDPCSLFLPVGVGFTADVPKYAKGATYSSEPAYLPGFGPGAGTEQTTSWWPWALGVAAVGGLVWWASRGGLLLANPGRAKKTGFTAADADPEQLRIGTKHELEHTDSKRVARQIALDHLSEDEKYYVKLDAMERGACRSNPADAGPPYTLEALNHLTGARVHTKATQHQTLESANTSAALRASQVRKFVTINVLDRRGGVVATHKGQH